jgi:hypothetical protein
MSQVLERQLIRANNSIENISLHTHTKIQFFERSMII